MPLCSVLVCVYLEPKQHAHCRSLREWWNKSHIFSHVFWKTMFIVQLLPQYVWYLRFNTWSCQTDRPNPPQKCRNPVCSYSHSVKVKDRPLVVISSIIFQGEHKYTSWHNVQKSTVYSDIQHHIPLSEWRVNKCIHYFDKNNKLFKC